MSFLSYVLYLSLSSSLFAYLPICVFLGVFFCFSDLVDFFSVCLSLCLHLCAVLWKVYRSHFLYFFLYFFLFLRFGCFSFSVCLSLCLYLCAVLWTVCPCFLSLSLTLSVALSFFLLLLRSISPRENANPVIPFISLTVVSERPHSSSSYKGIHNDPQIWNRVPE